VELEVPTVSVLAPRATAEPVPPVRSWIVAPVVVPEMSNVEPAPTKTPLDCASVPPPVSASVPALICVRPL